MKNKLDIVKRNYHANKQRLSLFSHISYMRKGPSPVWSLWFPLSTKDEMFPSLFLYYLVTLSCELLTCRFQVLWGWGRRHRMQNDVWVSSIVPTYMYLRDSRSPKKRIDCPRWVSANAWMVSVFDSSFESSHHFVPKPACAMVE